MSAASDPSVAKPLRTLACSLCQRRKVRCDRDDPCSNCVKANVVCTATAPTPARRRRRPNIELQARLARCEELLEAYSSAKVGQGERAANTNSLQPSRISAIEHPHLNWKPAGKLVVDDGAVRFTDNFLWATVYEELRAMREIIDTDGTNNERSEWRPSATILDHHENLLFGPDTVVCSVEELQPTSSQKFRLWQVYLDRVNPITKIVHIPTLQPYLVDASSGSPLPKNMEALLFSIYAMAVVSLTEEECLEITGYPGKEAFRRFSTGVRMSLISIGFLQNHDLTTLQALVLHLYSLQGRYNSHAAWIMNGVCIRIAQKMGLHRDGELLGLPPFETEMRRRVWWQIVMLDVRYALMSGLTPSQLPRSCDCKIPKNLNDADLHPSAKEYLQDRNGPTEMIACLVASKFGEFILQRNGLDRIMLRSEMGAVSFGSLSKDQSIEHKELTEDLEDSLNSVMEKFSDPSAGPIHELTIQVKLAMSKKMQEMARPPHEQPEWGTEINTPRDNLFKLAVGAIEHAVGQYLATKHRGFLWFVQSFFQYDIFIYMIGQLRYRTSGNLVERAWEKIPSVYHYHQELFDTSQESNVTLGMFIIKAWAVRQEVLFARYGYHPDVPDYVQKFQDLKLSEDVAAAVASDVPVLSADPNMSYEGNHMDMWEQFFPGYPDSTTSGWDISATPQQKTVEEQWSAFEEFDIGMSADWADRTVGGSYDGSGGTK